MTDTESLLQAIAEPTVSLADCAQLLWELGTEYYEPSKSLASLREIANKRDASLATMTEADARMDRLAQALRVAVEALQVAVNCGAENRKNGSLPSYESEIAEFALATIRSTINESAK